MRSTPYIPSEDTIRLTNAINRGLEHPDKPEDIVSLILQGVSARYDCCPAPTESEAFNRPAGVDFKSFGQAVSHITITDKNVITLCHFSSEQYFWLFNTRILCYNITKYLGMVLGTVDLIYQK